MKKAEHNKRLGIPTVGFVFANIASMRRFMYPGNIRGCVATFFVTASDWFKGGGGGKVS